MGVFSWAATAGFLLSIVPPASAQAPSTTEFSCATFPPELSEANLVARFGSANVKRADVFGADDGPQPGVVVFDGTPVKLEAVWWDSGTRTRLFWVRSREPGSPWRSPNAISVGMDLQTIERRNGWPFRLAGLSGPEGLGRVTSWGRGRLQNAGTDGCSVTISLQATGHDGVDPKLYRQVDRGSVSSGHPAMQAINPRVASVIVSHNPVRRAVR